MGNDDVEERWGADKRAPGEDSPNHLQGELNSGGVTRAHPLPFGAEVAETGTRFRIFAPVLDAISVKLDHLPSTLPLQSEGNGWFSLTTPDAPAGSRYRYVLPDGLEVPDPASRFQPHDVTGPSEVIDPQSFTWHDTEWIGRPWCETVLYELHVGTFTEEGTFQAAIPKLQHLADIGITAIELMCLSDFAGLRNWGYDGVLLYAPDSAYGRPEDLKAFIEQAHALGIMVVLDVVYNHLGPEGNYLPRYFPQFCTESEHTPWGQALNFDGAYSEIVRELMVQNALYWIEEFHVDGLRLDAAHAMLDKGPKHILDELAERAHACAGGRHLHLILENDVYVPQRLERDSDGHALGYAAQWNHDMTHLLGAAMASGCPESLDADKGETTRLSQALTGGFTIAAEMHAGRNPILRAVPTAFIAFLQTHDLVGNRILGDRIFAIASREAVRAAYAVLLLLPQIPMIFMGDEFGSSSPFPYFCDFHGDLAEVVRKGRCEQLAAMHHASPEEMKRAPDPESDATFLSGKLHWSEARTGEHAATIEWFRRVLQVRHTSIVPLLNLLTGESGSFHVLAPGALICEWRTPSGAGLRLEANLCGKGTAGFRERSAADALWTEGAVGHDGEFGPWTVRWSKLAAKE